MCKNVRIIRYLCIQQFREKLCSPKIWAGYILGIIFFQIPVVQYLKYANMAEVQVCEGALVSLANPINIFALTTGILLILSDAPFVTDRSVTMIYRISRKIWGYAMCVYIVGQTVIYYGLAFLISLLLMGKNGYVGSVWSRVMIRSVTTGSATAYKYGFSPMSQDILELFSPIKAYIYSYLLLCLSSIFFGILLFVLNLKFRQMIGYLVIIVLQFIGLSICRGYLLWIPVQIVPLPLSSLGIITSAGIPMPFAVCYFLLGSVFLVYLLQFFMRKADFRSCSGGIL